MESPISDSVEVSYSTLQSFKNEQERFKSADMVFVSSQGLTETLVTEIEILSLANGMSIDKVIVVGDKNFGASNGQIYAKRHNPDYFAQYIDVYKPERYIVENRRLAELYGNRFINLMSMVTNDRNQVRVFTPDHHFISADSGHLTKGGARFFGQMVDWSVLW